MFPWKFAVSWLLKILPFLAYVATLPCETLMPEKQAINDKLQGSVATYSRCGGAVNNQIKKGLLLNVSQSYEQERGRLVQFVRVANTLLKDEDSTK